MNRRLFSFSVVLASGLLALTAGCGTKAKPQPAEHAEEKAHHDEDEAHEGHVHLGGEATVGAADVAPAEPVTSPAEPAHADHEGHADRDPHPGHDAAEVHLGADTLKGNTIRVEVARKRALVPMLSVPARVEFNGEALAHVGSPLEGRIAELPVRLGDVVNKGDALLVVASPALGEAQSDFLQRKSAVRAAGPTLEVARSTYQRSRKLFEESQGIALAEVSRRELEFRAAEAVHISANSALAAAESKLRMYGMGDEEIRTLVATGRINTKHALHAPIDGTVVERRATLGELVGPERDALIVLADLSTLWVIANLPEGQLRTVKIGGVAHIWAGPDAPLIEAKIAYIAPAVDSSTRTGQVRLLTAGTGTDLRPGMFARVELAAPTSALAQVVPVLAVPDEAVQLIEGKAYVFVPVPNEPNAFAKREVAVGKAVGAWLPVLSGLREGESIAVSGTFLLKAELGKEGAEHVH